MDTGSFPGVKSGRGMTLAPHPLLVPWSRKSRAIPLLPLWAIWPVQNLSAYMRVNFTSFYMLTGNNWGIAEGNVRPQTWKNRFKYHFVYSMAENNGL